MKTIIIVTIVLVLIITASLVAINRSDKETEVNLYDSNDNKIEYEYKTVEEREERVNLTEMTGEEIEQEMMNDIFSLIEDEIK